MSDAIVKTDPTAAIVTASSIGPDLPSLFRLAKALREAVGFVPKHFRSEGEIVAAILTGQEMGLPPMTALRSIHVVDGKPALDASMQLALAKKAGIKHRWIADGSDSKTATLWLQRAGDAPHTQTYSIDDAKKAGLTGKQNWTKHTAAMLRARCISAAMRAYCPDVLGGAVYVPDELDEIRESTQRPGVARVLPAGAHAVNAAAMRALDDVGSDDPSAVERVPDAESTVVEATLLPPDEEIATWRNDIAELDSVDALREWCSGSVAALRGLPDDLRPKVWAAISERGAALGLGEDEVKGLFRAKGAA